MATRSLVIAMAAIALGSTAARAQLCDARPSFTYGTNQLSLLGDVRDLQSLAAQYAFGETGAYGHFTIGTVHFASLDASAVQLSAGAGSQVPMDTSGLWQLCPIASVALVRGPRDVDLLGDGGRWDVAESDLNLGVTLGTVTARSPNVQVVESASLTFVAAKVDVRNKGNAAEGSSTTYFGVLGLAFAVITNQTLAIRPNVLIPLGLKGARSGYGVTVSVNFGRRLPAPP